MTTRSTRAAFVGGHQQQRVICTLHRFLEKKPEFFGGGQTDPPQKRPRTVDYRLRDRADRLPERDSLRNDPRLIHAQTQKSRIVNRPPVLSCFALHFLAQPLSTAIRLFFGNSPRDQATR